jgi:Flp pilus assembly protein CpaB
VLFELSLLMLLGSSVVVGLGAAAYVRRAHLGTQAVPLMIGAGLMTVLTWGLAGAVAISALHQESKRLRAGWNLVPVLVASDHLRAGTVLDEQNVQSRPFPEVAVTSTLLTGARVEELLGKRLIAPVNSGEPFTLLHVGQGLKCSGAGR